MMTVAACKVRTGDAGVSAPGGLVLMTSAICTFFFITAGLRFAAAPGLIWGVGYTPLFLMPAMFWFMPWAIYTNIDAGTARTPQAPAFGPPGRAGGGARGTTVTPC